MLCLNAAAAVQLFNFTELKINSLKFQAVWALGNVAGDSPRCRDLVHSKSVMAINHLN